MLERIVETGRGNALRALLTAVASALAAPGALAQVQLHQHCNFGGWSASFTTTGDFSTAALVSRGGVDNDASSIRVAPGYRATLFSGNNQTGSSIVMTGDDACFVNDSFNDVLSSLRIEQIGGAPLVQLYQHCNFGGWVASFTATGNFSTTDLASRGGVNNDASSIRVAAGYRAALFNGNNQTGGSITVTGNDACFVDNSFNDVLSSLRVESTGGTGCDGPGGPPPTWQEHWFEHDQLVRRVRCDDHAAIYFDDDVDPAQGDWILDLVSRQWQYFKQTYGGFGPDPRMYSIHHQGRYFGGHPGDRFSSLHDFRNSSDIGVSSWAESGGNHDIASHEICHVVESSNNSVHGSPAFPVWGDSKWAEFCQYDLYLALGMTADANRVFTQFTNTTDNFPQPGTRWFRDWFYPLWRDHGGAQVMVRFFALLAQHFPKHTANHGNGNHQDYDRDLNLGELIHFMSGAAGTNLQARAQTAFGSGWQADFEQARSEFPGVTY